MTSVDLVVPCYNYGRFLKECVDSILRQGLADIRVLIIDDASPDETPLVGKEIAAHDPRVSFRRHELNVGHIATYNEGIDWARADFWMLISADDLLAPGALARAVRIVGQQPEVGLVFGNDVSFSSSGELPTFGRTIFESEEYEVISGREFISRSCQSGSNLVSTPTAFARTSLLRQIGGYRNELPHTADMELQLQIAARSRVAVLDSVQAFKRVHDASMARRHYSTQLSDIKGRKDAFDLFFESSSELMEGEADEMQIWAYRRLAQHAFWSASQSFDDGDRPASEDLHDLFLRLDPRAVSRGARLRWRLKRTLGPAVWRRISSLVDRVRSSA